MQIKKSMCVVVVVLLLCLCVMFVERSFSKDDTRGYFNHVSFAAHSNVLKFFDHYSGKIYVYSSKTGDLLDTWILKELGEDLFVYKPKIPGYIEKGQLKKGRY